MKYLAFLISMVISTSLQAQAGKLNNVYLWQDVLALEDLITKPGDTAEQELVRILKPYLSPNYIGSAYNNLFYVQIKNNPFLKLVIPPPDTIKNNAIRNSNPFPKASVANSNSGELKNFIEPTVILDALARLIQTRIVDELNLAYLDKLRIEIDSDPIFSALLPRTAETLKALGKSYSFQYRSYLSTLRRSCIEDIEYLPQNMESYVKTQRLKLRSKGVTNDQYVMLLAALRVMGNLRNQPEDIISDLGTYNYNLPKDTFANAAFVLQATALFSNHLRAYDPAGAWINEPTNRKKFLTNPRVAYLFFGLIYEKDSSKLLEIKTAKGTSLYNIMQGIPAAELIQELHQILGLMNELESLIKTKGTLKLTTGVDIAHFNLQLVERIFKSQFNPIKSNEASAKSDSIVKEILDIKYRLEQKRYASAINKTYTLLRCWSKPSCDSIGQIQVYAEFFDAIVRETNADSLVYILSAFAAPVGSYSIKRRSPFNVSLSSFPGALGGNETLLGENVSTKNKQAINSFAFTAPFGLALSTAISAKDSRGGHSLTVFFPLVDVGAITAFRFENGTAELPQVTWKNFFSPGAYLIFGIRQSPISLNAGFQYGPELRKIEVDKTPELVPSRRFSLGLTLDLHLFNLSHRLPSSESSKSGS